MKTEHMVTEDFAAHNTEACPVISVKISPPKYRYDKADICSSVTEKMLSDFEDGICRKQNADIPENFTLVACKYCSVLVKKTLQGECDFYTAYEKMLRVKNYCRTVFPIISGLCGKWMLGLAFVTGKYTDAEYIYDDNVFCFLKDYAVCELVHSFFKSDMSAFCKKLFPAVRSLCGIDCRKSPAYIQNSEIYENIMSVVIYKVYEEILRQMGKSFVIPKEKTIKLQAFPGLFCDSEIERDIFVTYIPYSENCEMSELLSANIKHTDNLIRQGLGIKSKFASFTLSSDYRRFIQDTIREEFPGFLPFPQKVGRKPKKIKVPDRNKDNGDNKNTPEPIDLNIDFSKAKKLLADSWKISDMLSADYGTNDITLNISDEYESEKDSLKISMKHCDNVEENTPMQDFPEEWQEFAGLLTEDEKKLLCLIANNANADVFARKRGGMLSGFADSINEKASDSYGDIILYDTGTTFEFIDDYDNELKDIFRNMYNTEVL